MPRKLSCCVLPLGAQSGKLSDMSSSTIAKEERLHIRASASQKALLARAAQTRHVKVSQFVLQTCLEAAEKVVREEEAQTAIMVSAEQYDWLMAKLEEPPLDNPALRQLFAETPTWSG